MEFFSIIPQQGSNVDHTHGVSCESVSWTLIVSLRGVCDPGYPLAGELFIAGVTQITAPQHLFSESSHCIPLPCCIHCFSRIVF